MEELRCLVDSPGLRITYDAANQWLYNQWHGVHNKESIWAGSLQVHACLVQEPCAKVLSDHSELRGDWLQGDAEPSIHYMRCLAELGVTHFAWVHGPDYQNFASIERAHCLITEPVVAIFENVASAYAWLQQCLGGAK